MSTNQRSHTYTGPETPCSRCGAAPEEQDTKHCKFDYFGVFLFDGRPEPARIIGQKNATSIRQDENGDWVENPPARVLTVERCGYAEPYFVHIPHDRAVNLITDSLEAVYEIMSEEEAADRRVTPHASQRR
jgi:hypothetical protein